MGNRESLVLKGVVVNLFIHLQLRYAYNSKARLRNMTPTRPRSPWLNQFEVEQDKAVDAMDDAEPQQIDLHPACRPYSEATSSQKG